MMTSVELVALTGITYRQLDFWARAGYIQPTRPGEGSGKAREWESPETFVAIAMARLVCAGLLPHVAGGVARELVTRGRLTAMLSGGVQIVMSDPVWMQPTEVPGQLDLIEGVI